MTNTQFEQLIGALRIMSATLSRIEDSCLRAEARAENTEPAVDSLGPSALAEAFEAEAREVTRGAAAKRQTRGKRGRS